MFGMLIVLVSAGVWLLMATYWELPVSTTHTTGKFKGCSRGGNMVLAAEQLTQVCQQHMAHPASEQVIHMCPMSPDQVAHAVPEGALLPSAVGAVVGMAVVMRGFDSVLWSAHQDPFPYVKG